MDLASPPPETAAVTRRRHGVAPLARVAAMSAALLASLFPFAQPVAAASTVAATGGSAISADTAGTGGSGAWTSLIGPVVAESAAGQVGVGTITLSVPAGFEFNPSAGAVTMSGGACAGLSLSPLAVTAATATTTASGASTGACTLTWSGLQVRPLNGTPRASGSITRGGTATVSGVATGMALGTLAETAGAPAKLAFTGGPTGGTGGTAFASQPAVAVGDQFGNVATSASGVIALAITGGTGTPGAALACTGGTTKSTTGGAAAFSGCAIDLLGNGYTLTASASGLVPAVSSAFSISVGTPARAVFAVPPGGGTGGTAWATQPSVRLLDAGGNATSATTSVTLGITSGTGTVGAALSCTGGLTKTAVAGVATFSSCTVDKAGTGYSLTASGSGVTAAVSTPFAVAVGPPAKLAFTAQPGGGTAGAGWASQPSVAVADAGGNTVAGATDMITLAIGANAGGGALTCTSGKALAAAGGVAAFGGCAIDKTGTGYTLAASAPGLAGATSSAFTVTAAGAAALAVAAQPGGGTGGVAFGTQPSFRIVDAFGNTVTTSTATVTLALSGGAPGAALSCTGGNTKAAVAGVATFAGCRVDLVGTGYTLMATATGLAGVTTATFPITVGAAAQLAFVQQPGGGTGGTAWATQPSLRVLDAGGNLVTSSSLSVTLSITSGTGTTGATLACTPSLSASAVAGVVSFAGCRIDKTGAGYTVKASGAGVTAATSTTFAVTVGAASKLAFGTQPGGGTAGAGWTTQPAVLIQDAGGNTVPTAANAVTVAIGAGAAGAALACTGGLTVTAAAGRAAFAGCTIDKAGAGYTLLASASGLTGAASGTFTVIAASGVALAVTTQPSGGTGGTAWAVQPVVRVVDAWGNTAASTAPIALAITGGTGTSAAVLSCTGGATKAASAGVATFAGCKIDLAGTGYTLTATSAGLATVTTAALSVAVGAPALATFTVQPGGGTGGLAWAAQPAVQLLDAGGNPTTTATTSLTLAITSGTGTSGAALSCTGGLSRAAVAGIATFTGCAIDKAGSGYTLKVTGAGLTAATSAPLTIAIGPGAKLLVKTQPGGGVAGTAWATQPVVAVADAGGNTVTGATDTVTLAMAANPGAATLACTGGPSLDATAGLAAFGGCTVDRTATGYTLTASAPGLASATTAAFSVTPAAAASIAFTAQPGGGTGGVAWPAQPAVKVFDAYGNVVTSSTAAITLTLSGGAPGAALACSGGNAKAAVAGVATFAGCKVDRAGSDYALSATAAGLAGADSSTFGVIVGPAAQLVFAAQPGGGTGGSTWAQQPSVSVLDAGGNAVTSSALAVTLAITSGTGTTGAVLACTGGLTSAAAAGVATFAGCRIDKSGANYTLKANGTGVTAGTSIPFTVAVGAPAKLAFTTTPTSITAGATFGTQPSIAVQDAGGNVVAAAADQVTIAISSGTGATGANLICPGGTVKAAVSGIAAYSGCTVDKVGTGYTLTGSAAGLASATSGGFAVSAGPASALQFVTEPSGGTGGSVWSAQPSVRIVDAYGNLATGSATIALSIAPGTGSAGAALACTGGQTKVTTASVASFTGCRIDRAGSAYALVASATSLVPGTSADFDVVPGTGVSMVFSGQPGGGVAMTGWGVQPVVTVLDAGGNVAAGSTGQIQLAVATGPTGASLACLGGLVDNAVAGVATFAGCQLDKAGTFTLSATAAGLPIATSASFTVVAGTPTHLAFSAQPGGGTGGLPWSTQPVLSLQDDGGNTVTTGGLTVTLSLTANPAGGTFTCNGGLSRLTQAGVATFTGCTIDTAGAGFQLTASLSGGGAADAVSTLFNVVTGPAARLAFETSPAGGTGGVAWTTQPVVIAADAGGNATTATPAITIAIEAGSGATGATLTCPSGATRTAVAGRAAWAGCSIDRAAATYQLRATAPGLLDGLSTQFAVVAGPASKLGFSMQPSGGPAGVPWTVQPAVLLLDAGGNPASGATPVTLDIPSNPGGGTLTCTGGTTATPVAGVATFAGCWIDKAGSTYQVRAAAAGLTPATSGTFGIVAGAASRLTFSASPAGGAGGSAFPVQPTVRLEDAFGNLATSGSLSVTLSVGVNPSGGSLACNGGTALAASGGIAAFNSCRIDLVGTAYQLTASAPGLASASSAPFDIVAGSPARLVFALQPSGGPGGSAWSVQPVVAVRDAGGNPTVATVPVTLALGANPGSGTLVCTTGLVQTTANGTVAFGGCTVDRAASGYTLLATASGLTGAVTASFDVTVGPPARLGFAVQPSGGAAGSLWTTQPIVAVEDAGGNLVPDATDVISLAPSSGAAGALACSGGTSMHAVSGAAVFSGCSWTAIGSGNVVQAMAPGLAPATSAPFTVTVGTPARLRFATAPSGALGGSAFSVQPVVQVTDAWDNPVTSSSVAVTLSVQANAAGGTLTCNAGPVRTTSAGLATFSGCAIDKAGGAYRLVATSSGLSDAVGPSLDVVPGPAARLAFVVQPGTGTGGSPLGTQPVVALLDAGGNQTTSGTGSVTIALTPGAGTTAATLRCAGGTVVAPSSGLASFDGCAVDRVGIGYTLTAARTGFASVVSSAFSVATGPAAALVLTTSPSGGAGGTAWDAQPVVRVVDRGGNPVASGAPVTVGLAQNPTGGALTCSGGLTKAAAAGVATFSGCAIDKAGTGYALAATSPGLTSATGPGFAIAAGPAARTSFTASPGDGPAATGFAVQPRVELYDAGGNHASSSTPVTLTIATGTGTAGAILACPGGTTRSAVAGVAAFAGCSIDRAGPGYRLQASGPGLATSLSAPFTISAPAAVLTLTPSTLELTYPASLTLRATFAQLGGAKPVAFQASSDGITWAPLATVTSTSQGTASYTLTPSLNRKYRASFLGDAILGPGTSAVVSVGVHQVVSLSPSTGTTYKSVRRGAYVTFTSAVKPWSAGRPLPSITFTVYKYVSGTWRKVTAKSVRANAYGKASWRYAFGSTGKWGVTARAGATTITLTSAASARSRFKVS